MIRRNLTALAFALTILPLTQPVAAAGEDVTAPLTIELTGLKPQGTIRMAIFDSKEGYDSGKALGGRDLDVDSDVESVTLESLKPGTYAIKLYHDVNDNGTMDTNPFGMPTEPYAFSNNARGNFGPAKWDKAQFELTADGTVQSLKVN